MRGEGRGARIGTALGGIEKIEAAKGGGGGVEARRGVAVVEGSVSARPAPRRGGEVGG